MIVDEFIAYLLIFLVIINVSIYFIKRYVIERIVKYYEKKRNKK